MKIRFLIFSMFLASCAHSEIKKSELIGNQIMCQFMKGQMKKGLDSLGTGGSLDHTTWKNSLFAMTFSVDHLKDIESARKLFVETANDFIVQVNSIKGIEEYIAEYPMTVKSVRISILTHEECDPLFSVSNSANEVIYRKRGPVMYSPSIEVHRESFEEAQRIVSLGK